MKPKNPGGGLETKNQKNSGPQPKGGTRLRLVERTFEKRKTTTKYVVNYLHLFKRINLRYLQEGFLNTFQVHISKKRLFFERDRTLPTVGLLQWGPNCHKVS